MHTLNWVDLLMVGVMALSINGGRKSDLFTELVVLCGVMASAFFSLHYYVRLGNFLSTNFVLPEKSQEVLAFLILTGAVIGIAVLVKGGWRVILKFPLNRHFDNWGGLVLSVIRSYFLCSIILFNLLICPQLTIENSARKSYSSIVFQKASLWVYGVAYTNFIKPFFPEEPLNQKAFRVINDSSKG